MFQYSHSIFIVILATPEESVCKKKRASYYISDKINLIKEVLTHVPFNADDPNGVWSTIADNVSRATNREFLISGRSAKEHFYMMLKYHRADDQEKLKK